MAPCCKKLAILFLLFSFYCLFHSTHSCLALLLLNCGTHHQRLLTLPAASDRRTMTNNTKPVLPPRVSELAVCMEPVRGKSAWNSPQDKGFLKQALQSPTCCIHMQNVTHQKVRCKYDPKKLLVHVCFIFILFQYPLHTWKLLSMSKLQHFPALFLWVFFFFNCSCLRNSKLLFWSFFF